MNQKPKSILTSSVVILCVWLILRFGYAIYPLLKLPQPFFEFASFALLSALAIFFYKILKLKISFNTKYTEPKYWLWSLLLVILLILGDVLVGDPYQIKVRNVFIALVYPLFIAFYEEMINRVVLLKILENAFGFKAALVIQAVVFTFFHYDFRISAIIYYFILGGIGMGLLMNPKKGHFFYPLTVHYVAEVVMMLMRL